jgi:hypothetical protein
VVFLLFGGGVLLARAGAYLRAPWLLLLMWVAPVGAIAAAVWWYRTRLKELEARRLAASVEAEGKLRRGSLAGVAGDETLRGSGALAALADTRAAEWLAAHGDGALAPTRRRGARVLGVSGMALAAAAAVFVLAQPTSGRAASFWNPVGTVARARGPVQVVVDRDQVRRGERIQVTVTAVGRADATLWTRAPGEPWQAQSLVLDSAGRATLALGPLESDQYLRAGSGGRTSEIVHVRVSLPSFLAELSVVARYPEYLNLADEPLMPGTDTVLVPVGTRLVTQGRATVPLRSAGWAHGGGSTGLVANGQEFSGDAVIERSGTWHLLVVPSGGGALEDAAPELRFLAVRDSLPSVSVPVPGGDTTAPATLKQPLVIDVRDDNRVSRVELVSRRVSRSGVASGRQTEVIPVPQEGAERLVLQWLLDLNGQGYNPGDTAYFKVRAFDNAPTPQMAETREYVLRLPTLAEMREAVREAQRMLTGAVDSLLKNQTALAQEAEDAAAERERQAESNRPGEEALAFQEVEKAEELAQRQQEVLNRAEELREEVRELSEAAKSAGLNDPEFHQQLRELQQMMERALTPEMREQLAQLRESLQKLDGDQSRERMQQMSESARQLQEQLEQSKEMFERAAIEGAMTTLASDAEDLAQRQREWNDAARRNVDSSMAQAEKKMATEADSLAARLEELEKLINQAKGNQTELQDSVQAADSTRMANQQQQQQPDSARGNQQNPRSGDEEGPPPTQAQQARQAAQDMRQAAQEAEKRNAERARGEGQEASQKMDPMAQQLRQNRDNMRASWKSEVVGKMDHALAEASELARQQQEIAERLQRGDASADVRGQQAALKEGMDKMIERLQSAAGQNALVSPEISTALGYTRMQMREALEQLQQPVPNTRSAASIAGQAVTGLTSVAHSLLTAREDVQSSGSGSGFSEAVQRLANMAGTQSALAGQSGQLLPIWQRGNQGQDSQEQLQRMGAQQRRIADELDQLDAQGEAPSGVEQLAEEARRISREMEGGQLDRRTVERQDRLFRRLLDAGRTLTGEEEDDKEERKSETAKDGNVLVPPALRPGAAGSGPRFPYPTWEQLRQLSPEERRLILDYFRRLNDAR